MEPQESPKRREVIAPRAKRPLVDEPLTGQIKHLERENIRLWQEKEILKKAVASLRAQSYQSLRISFCIYRTECVGEELFRQFVPDENL